MVAFDQTITDNWIHCTHRKECAFGKNFDGCLHNQTDAEKCPYHPAIWHFNYMKAHYYPKDSETALCGCTVPYLNSEKQSKPNAQVGHECLKCKAKLKEAETKEPPYKVMYWNNGKPESNSPTEQKRLDKRTSIIIQVLKDLGYKNVDETNWSKIVDDMKTSSGVMTEEYWKFNDKVRERARKEGC